MGPHTFKGWPLYEYQAYLALWLLLYEMESMTQVQTLDKAVYLSLLTNAPWRMHESNYSPSSYE